MLGDRVYVTCHSGYGTDFDDGEPKDLMHDVVCFERATGKQVWQRDLPGPLGKPAPQVQLSEHGFASPTPITDGKKLYVYFGRAACAPQRGGVTGSNVPDSNRVGTETVTGSP